MTLNEPQQYNLLIANDFSYKLSQNDAVCLFSKPATVRGIAKLYTVVQDNVLLYVGIAKQPMSSRLNNGFKANGRNGYHGYKWKTIRDNLKLNIWTASENTEYISFEEIEIIEAEVAYLCRRNSGQWPRHQHEIHFHQSNSTHRELAKIIYDAASN